LPVLRRHRQAVKSHDPGLGPAAASHRRGPRISWLLPYPYGPSSVGRHFARGSPAGTGPTSGRLPSPGGDRRAAAILPGTL